MLLIPFQRSGVANAGTPKDVAPTRVKICYLIFTMEGREKGIKGVVVRGRDQIFFEEVLK